jgi:hypothetical protein
MLAHHLVARRKTMHTTAPEEIPEPDFPNYEDKSKEELEEEIRYLGQEHREANVLELACRVYALNKKYKARKRRKGTGAKAYCESIGWNLDHWNHLVKIGTPPEEKQAKAAKRLEAKLAKSQSAHIPLMDPPINSIDELKLSITHYLDSQPADRQLETIVTLGEWLVSLMKPLEETLAAA